jgi:hypothetical protein
MAEETLDSVQVGASLEEVGGEGVAQGMDTACLRMPARAVARMEIFWGTVMSMGRVPWRLGKTQCPGAWSVP